MVQCDAPKQPLPLIKMEAIVFQFTPHVTWLRVLTNTHGFFGAVAANTKSF